MKKDKLSPSMSRLLAAFADDLGPRASNLDLFVGSLTFMDYDSQLIAIRQLLDQHRRTAGHSLAELRAIEEIAQKRSSNRIADEWVDRLHSMVYQDIAHSMAAVGLIVLFLESLFGHVFRFIEQESNPPDAVVGDHERWHKSAKRRWDCYYSWRNGRWQSGRVQGILQLAHLTDMMRHLPCDLEHVLSALYAYRNKMLHCGFEWPMDERKDFDGQLKEEDWPSEWFSQATSGDDPWVFYMTPEFVDHCVLRIDEIADGIGAYWRRLYEQ